MIDSNGLTFEGRLPLDEDKREFALTSDQIRAFGFERAQRYDLEMVVHNVRPTILIGTSGTPGVFSERVVREMAGQVHTPVILPLSNPTSRCEATPVDVLGWSDGRALVATGSPFDPVVLDGRSHTIGQANNAFIFPGIGLGAIVSQAREMTDGMFLAAARTLAGQVTETRLAVGGLYPATSDLRSVSREIAIAVVQEARDCGVGRAFRDEEIPAAVDAAMWWPEYAPYRPSAFR